MRIDDHRFFARDLNKDYPVCVKGEGVWVWDENGKKYLDGCSGANVASIGHGVKEIGESAFFGCRSLMGVLLERGLETVGDNAFAGCDNLTQITLPWGTGSVGRMAFFGCTRLSFVKMPATTRVRDLAFDGCAPGLRVFGGVSAGRLAHETGMGV